MAILIDKRIQKYVEGCVYEEDKAISIHLKDIDEKFWFNSEVTAQEFLNKQATERVGNSELRTDSFDYTDEEGVIHRYLVTVNKKGKIISYLEEVVNEFTENELSEKYGYLVDNEKNIDALIDIMQYNGIDVVYMNGRYLVSNEICYV